MWRCYIKKPAAFLPTAMVVWLLPTQKAWEFRRTILRNLRPLLIMRMLDLAATEQLPVPETSDPATLSFIRQRKTVAVKTSSNRLNISVLRCGRRHGDACMHRWTIGAILFYGTYLRPATSEHCCRLKIKTDYATTSPKSPALCRLRHHETERF